MALTNKQRKKLNRTLEELEKQDRQHTLEILWQYYIIFWFAIFFDAIANRFLIHYTKGFGWEQGLVAFICLVQMFRQYGKLDK